MSNYCVTIIGSFSEASAMLKMASDFEMGTGCRVLQPTKEHVEAARPIVECHHEGKPYTPEIIELLTELQNEYFEAIDGSDIVVCRNKKNGEEHVGLAAATEIGYAAPGHGPVEVSIYNIRGQRIRTFQTSESGPGTVLWDGTDTSGIPVGTGIYLCTLRSAGQTRTVKLLLMN